MSVDPITAGIDLVKSAIDRIWPDASESERTRIAAILSLSQGQMATNTVEAQHRSIFVAGWRPGLGWVCVFSLAYTYLFYPTLLWAAAIWTPELKPPILPTQDNLFELLLGMLGLAGMRSFERVKGKA